MGAGSLGLLGYGRGFMLNLNEPKNDSLRQGGKDEEINVFS